MKTVCVTLCVPGPDLVSQVQSGGVPVVRRAQVVHHVRVAHAQVRRRLPVHGPNPPSCVAHQVPAGQTALLQDQSQGEVIHFLIQKEAKAGITP